MDSIDALDYSNREVVIDVSHVTKTFKVYLDKGNTLKERMIFSNRRKYEVRHVLNDISFQVHRGEAVGLIGHNGCGKSTTLKLLTRIMYPDSGSITMRGRVSSLIELGAGFHPDMSGRENIYINASIFGLTKKEIDDRLDDIIAFSELEEFIDNPVRTYSSGMYMRLAFSVAINVDADILLIDEILAVGDANFQAKCFNKMREIKAQGTTIVLVSHSMGQVEQLCDRSIWINDGKIVQQGNPKEVDLAYLERMNQEHRARVEQEAHDDEKAAPSSREEKNRYGNFNARISSVRFVDDDDKPINVMDSGDSCTLKVAYHVEQSVEDAVFGIGIFRNDGLNCYGTNTRLSKMKRFSLEKDGAFSFRIENLNLAAAQYWLDIAIESGEGIPVDYYKEAVRFEVVSGYADAGVVKFGHEWKLS